MRRFLAGIILLIILGGVSPSQASATATAPADASTFSPSSFAKEMGILSGKLESNGWSPEKLRSLRESLPKNWTVISDGRRFDVTTGPLASRLRSAEAHPADHRKLLDEAREYLDALAAEAESLSAEPPQSSEPARAKLKAILARREFSASRQPNLWEQLRARINELILRALDWIFGRAGGAKSFGNVLLWIGICAAAVFIAYWVFRQWFRAARMQEMAIQAASSPAHSWQEWVFAARDAAGRGDYRTAVHCSYWAGIARLQELGALPSDLSKTPREYLRTLGLPTAAAPRDLPGLPPVAIAPAITVRLDETGAAKPGNPTTSNVLSTRQVGDVSARRQALTTLTSLLEKFWYGGQAATEAEFRDSLAHLEALGCHLV